MLKVCCDHLPKNGYDTLLKELQVSDRYADAMTAWRLEGTLREFPKFQPKNLWFRYPVHEEDIVGVLKDIQVDAELKSYQRGAKRGHETQKKQAKAEQADKSAELLNVFDMVNVNGKVTVQDIAEFLGVTDKTVRRRLEKCEGLSVDQNVVRKV